MKTLRHVVALCCLLACTMATALGQSLPTATPAEVGMLDGFSQDIDRAVAEQLELKKLPGCVVLIGRHGKVVHRQAYGYRRLEPSKEEMTLDTVFDMASLTKPIATSTSIMQLVSEGKLRLRDKVSDYFPEFGANGKEDITVKQLLLHSAGLIPDTAVSDYVDGWGPAYEKICQLEPMTPPGETFKYSDVGFQMLGVLVEKVSGQPVDEYSAEHIFKPLGMTETMYTPPQSLKDRAVTTEKEEGEWLRGVVHDPRTRLCGGVAGHAGLFSTADDLSLYANALLTGGMPVVSSTTLKLWTRPVNIDGNIRCLGWDMNSVYSRNRGETMSDSAFGHGGFTGTAMWIDPELDLFVIFLSNRVHPNGKGEINNLAGRIGTIVSSACHDGPTVAEKSTAKPSSTVLGIDVLAGENFALLQGKRIGLIANHTSLNAAGESTIDILAASDEVNLVALFSPEHGIRGTYDQPKISDTVDEATQLPVYSLYGETRKPTPEHMDKIDVMVFDIQDIGCRFYTYVSTMGLAMEAAAESGKTFVVLDRPNPIGGHVIEGPILDEGSESFVGFHTIPVRHGMTIGELAEMLRAERGLDVDLKIVKLQDWDRSQYLYSTGLPWVNTSPNMRSLTEALLYPGIGLFEMTNLSVGRGTDTPFEVVGAPWIDGVELSAAINKAQLPGVSVVPIRFTPTTSKYEGETCGGINVIVTDWQTFRPVDLAWVLATNLHTLYPEQWEIKRFNRLLSSKESLELISSGATPQEIIDHYQGRLQDFETRRAKFLLY